MMYCKSLEIPDFSLVPSSPQRLNVSSTLAYDQTNYIMETRFLNFPKNMDISAVRLYIKLCSSVTIWTDLQLPNFRGHACASIGKSSRCMGHSAWMVNLGGTEGEMRNRQCLRGEAAVWLRQLLWANHDMCQKTVHFHWSQFMVRGAMNVAR